MFQVLVSDKLGQAGIDLLESAEDTQVEIQTGLSEQQLIDLIPSYDGLIIRSGTTVTEAVVNAGANLKIVGRAGVGVDNVDLPAATKAGVAVVNTPAANTIATAELTMALMLAATRNVGHAHKSMTEGRWDRSSFAGVELSGKTLGIMGLGRVGRAVAARAQAFGMNVVAYDPFVSETVAREAKVSLLNLDDLLASADVITLHMSLTDDTAHIINQDSIAKMNPGAIVINAARGGLIHESDAAAALDTGALGALGVDVFSSEPPADDNPLVGHPRVTHTPHLGASTAEAQRDVAVQVAQQVLNYLRGEPVENCVNVASAASADSEVVAPFVEVAAKIGRMQLAMAEGSITSVEVEVQAEGAEDLLRPVAAAILKGILDPLTSGRVNFVNAPLLASERGIKVSRSVSLGNLDYPNVVSCRVTWAEADGGATGERTVAGAVFGSAHPRIVKISGYNFEANPSGTVLLMLNDDVPGVIGEVGTVLGTHGVNIAEWRLGRDGERNEAFSFINLDSEPEPAVLESLREMPAIRKAITITL